MGARLGRRAILLVYALLILLPLVVVVFGSFKTSTQLFGSPFAPPSAPTLRNYRSLFSSANIGVPFMNSVIVTLTALVLTLLTGSLAAYGVARIPGWRGWAIYGFLVLGMSVPVQASIVPLYVLFQNLNLTNSLTGLILIEVVRSIPVAVFILGGFMRTLPREMYEASAVDGSGPWRTYASVVMPLSAPSVAATAIFIFVIMWNDLLYPLMLTTDPSVQTLPLALLSFQGEYQTNYPTLFSAVIIASLPVVIAYVFLQRYFVAGLTAGATKG
ncbi:carbohydrate ABC transporter permease [Streptomyces sp. NPDC048636]|uniref:carbohydrate ABC transporter permease n=1 Tax=Streptomyces sp. NPDC048636 TaxID=3155762 RepID=UPI00344841BF